jgi:hypothetical protein
VQVGYLLTRLLAEHPAMNLVVVREVERFMFRCGGNNKGLDGACDRLHLRKLLCSLLGVSM